jgi:hypothetical protein
MESRTGRMPVFVTNEETLNSRLGISLVVGVLYRC